MCDSRAAPCGCRMRRSASGCRAICADAGPTQISLRRSGRSIRAGIRTRSWPGSRTTRRHLMQPFKYDLAKNGRAARRALASNPEARFIAGGTNILDLMREGVERPSLLLDITRLDLTQIKAAGGGVSIGALAKNTDTANHPLIRQNYP